MYVDDAVDVNNDEEEDGAAFFGPGPRAHVARGATPSSSSSAVAGP